MMELRRILWLACLAFLALPLRAQSAFSELSRYPEGDCFEMLDGNRGVLILSKHNDLVVSIANHARPFSVDMRGRDLEGNYRYYVVIDAEDTRQPKLEVSRRGIPYKASLLVSLKNPDYLQAYRLEEVSTPIRYEDQTEANDVHFNAEEAALEFTSTLQTLQVQCAPELQARITGGKSEADASLTVVEVVIPLAPLNEARERLERVARERDELDRLIETLGPDSPEWDEVDQRDARLKAEQEEAQKQWTALSSVELHAEGSNYLSVSIADLGPRSKRVYVVLPIIVTETVFKTECSRLMDEGSRLFGMRKYAAAREAYQQALQTGESVVRDMETALRSSVALCDSCLYYDGLVADCLKRIGQMKKSGHATQAEVNEYASSAISFLQQLYKFNPDDYYQGRVQMLEDQLKSMGLQVKFTFVEWLTFSEGQPIAGVEVWEYHGTDRLSSADFSSDKKFRRLLKKQGHNLRQVGQSGADGIAEVEMDRRKLPYGIVFRPREDSGQKIVYMTLEELMRQARGTYMKKQFRVKMYTK